VSGRRPWGWHRLDPDWAERIVASAAIRPGELVVDLGAGVGALTLPLLEAGARVIAVELHAGRARRLREKVSDHAASVVECDLVNFVPPGRPFGANPPYALTAAVLALIAHARHVTAADLVLQRAVVARPQPRPSRPVPLPRPKRPPPPAKRLCPAPTYRLSRPPFAAAEEVANIPRNQHRPPSPVRPRQDRVQEGESGATGNGEGRKKFETLGIAKSA
jgi:23S rRNA (adenine-N6)-dimethyltransferase